MSPSCLEYLKNKNCFLVSTDQNATCEKSIWHHDHSRTAGRHTSTLTKYAFYFSQVFRNAICGEGLVPYWIIYSNKTIQRGKAAHTRRTSQECLYYFIYWHSFNVNNRWYENMGYHSLNKVQAATSLKRCTVIIVILSERPIANVWFHRWCFVKNDIAEG